VIDEMKQGKQFVLGEAFVIEDEDLYFFAELKCGDLDLMTNQIIHVYFRTLMEEQIHNQVYFLSPEIVKSWSEVFNNPDQRLERLLEMHNKLPVSFRYFYL
jgi:hypothetical protein